MSFALWHAILFSGGAAAVLLTLIWWFYLSPAKAPAGPVYRPSLRAASWIAALLGLAVFQQVTGAWWDGSMHILTGRIPAGADFLWPPHLMIYSGFVITLCVTVGAILMLALPNWRVGLRDPRIWFRRNPYIGAVALAALYGLMTIPGDALWHQIFGPDLTAWSPPHVLLAVTIGIQTVAATTLLIQSSSPDSWQNGLQLGCILLLALSMSIVHLIGVVEWELVDRTVRETASSASRPLWLYPVVTGAIAFFFLALAQRLVRLRWAATTTTVIFLLIRLTTSTLMGLTGNLVPMSPLIFLLGAVALDWLRQNPDAQSLRRDIMATTGFTLGYAVVAIPMVALRIYLISFTTVDALLTLLVTLAICLLLLPVVRWVGRLMLGWQTASD